MSQNNGPISRLVNQSINSVVKPKKAAPPRMAPTAADYLLGRAQVPQPPAQAPNPIANQQRQNAQTVRRMSPGIDRVANPSNERRVQIRANTPGTPENTRELVRRRVAALPIPDEWRAGVEALVDSALFIRTTYIDPETGMRRRVSPLASQNAIRQTGLLDPNDAMEVVELLKTEGGVRLLQTEVKQFQDQRGRGQAQAKELEALARPGNVDPNIAGIGAVIDAATMSPIGRAVSDVIQNDPANIAGLAGVGEAVVGAFQDAGLGMLRNATLPLQALQGMGREQVQDVTNFLASRAAAPLNQGLLTRVIPSFSGRGANLAQGVELGLRDAADSLSRNVGEFEPLRMLGVDPEAIERGIRQFGQSAVRGFAGGVSSMTRIPQLLGSKEWADLSDAIDKGIAMREADKPLDKTFFNEIGQTAGGVVAQIAPALITGGSSIGASVAGRMAASAVFGMTEAATNAAGGFDRAVKEGQNIEEARQRAFRAMPVDAIVSSVLNKLGAFGELSPAWKKMFASSFTEGLQETFQTGLEGYVATGELDFTSPEAIKGGLLGMILGPLMGGGIDLATGPQMEGGAEAVPQRSAAASAPPVAPPVAPVTDAEPQINPSVLSQFLAMNTPQGAMPDFPRTAPAGMPQPAQAQQEAQGQRLATTRPDSAGDTFYETTVPKSQITVAPGMQFKVSGIEDGDFVDPTFVSQRDTYDYGTAGPLTVWERRDGSMVVVNGHHRLALAKKDPKVSDLPVRVYREADGVTFSQMRSKGAIQNLMDGKGTPLDYAVLFREGGMDTEALRSLGVPVSGPLMNAARGLASLNDKQFQQVFDGDIPQQVAAQFGGQGLPANIVDSLFRQAIQGEVDSPSVARQMVNQAKRLGAVKRESESAQDDLFGGDFSIEDVPIREMGEIMDAVVKVLRRGKNDLARLLSGEAVGGTVIDKAAQRDASQQVAFALEIINSSSEANRLLEEGAKQVAVTGNTKLINEYAKKISEVLQADASARASSLQGATPARTQGRNQGQATRNELARQPQQAPAKSQPVAPAEPKAVGEMTMGRSRPVDQIDLDVPIVGPSGAKLTSYRWQWKESVEWNEGKQDFTEKRVSNWDAAVANLETGRDIVHQFVVEMPDGGTRVVSLETAAKVLGFNEPNASLKSAASSLKTKAKNLMRRQLLQAQLDAWDAAYARAEAVKLPEPQFRDGLSAGAQRRGLQEISVDGGDTWHIFNQRHYSRLDEINLAVRQWREDQAERESGVSSFKASSIRAEIKEIDKRIAKQAQQAKPQSPAEPKAVAVKDGVRGPKGKDVLLAPVVAETDKAVQVQVRFVNKKAKSGKRERFESIWIPKSMISNGLVDSKFLSDKLDEALARHRQATKYAVSFDDWRLDSGYVSRPAHLTSAEAAALQEGVEQNEDARQWINTQRAKIANNSKYTRAEGVAKWKETLEGAPDSVKGTDAYKSAVAEFNELFGKAYMPINLDRQSPDILASPSKPAKSKDTITVDGKERPRTNSNGQPIHPTEEGIRAFWKWFGDSKVVDEQGRPLVVYHSTLDSFSEFAKVGKFMGYTGVSGISVTDNPEMASRYLDRFGERRWDGVAFKKGVMPLYVKADAPLYRDEPFSSKIQMGAPLPPDYVNPVEAMGYDALIRNDAISRAGTVKHSTAKNAIRGREIVVFDPTQIKSAIGNQGTFSPDNPSILASPRRVRRGMAPEPTAKPDAPVPQLTPAAPKSTPDPRAEARKEAKSGGHIPKIEGWSAPEPKTPAGDLNTIRMALDRVFPRHTYGRNRAGTKGTFNLRTGFTMVGYVSDSVTRVHELAHQIEKVYGLMDGLDADTLSLIDAELAGDAFGQTVPDKASESVERSERFAEWLTAYIEEPVGAAMLAPTVLKVMVERVPAQARAAIDEFSSQVQGYRNLPPEKQMALRIEDPSARKTFVDTLRSWFAQAAQAIGADGAAPDMAVHRTKVVDGVWRAAVTNTRAPIEGAVLRLAEMQGFKVEGNAVIGMSADPDNDLLNSPLHYIAAYPYLVEMTKTMLEGGLKNLRNETYTHNGQPLSVVSLLNSLTHGTEQLKSAYAYMFAQRFESLKGRWTADEQAALEERQAARVAKSDAQRARKERQLTTEMNYALSDMAKAGKTARQIAAERKRREAEIAKELDALDVKRAKKLASDLKRDYAYTQQVLRKRLENMGLTPGETLEQIEAAQKAIMADFDAKPEAWKKEVRSFAAQYRAIGDASLDVLVGGGILSRQEADEVRRNNPYWISARRVKTSSMPGLRDSDRDSLAESGASQFFQKNALTGTDDGINQFKGSQANIQDPVASLMQNIFEAYRAAYINKSIGGIVALAEGAGPGAGMFDDITDTVRADRTVSNFAPGETVRVYRQVPVKNAKGEIVRDEMGEPVTKTKEFRYVVLDPSMQRAFRGASRQFGMPDIPAINVTLRVLALPKRLLQWGVVVTPMFKIFNVIRDTAERVVGGRHDRSLAKVFSTRPLNEYEYRSMGIGIERGGILGDRNDYQNMMTSVMRNLNPRNTMLVKAGAPFRWFHSIYFGKFSVWSESVNRTITYNAALKKAKERGMSDSVAALWAAGEARAAGTDFARHGAVTAFFDTFIPFLNPAVQGQATFWTNAAKNPKRFMARLIMYALIGAGLEELWALKDGTSAARRDLPPYQRYMFWNFHIKDDKWLRIPKGHELGAILALGEEARRGAAGEEMNLPGVGRSMFQTMSPVSDSDIYGPLTTLIQWNANRDFFTGNTIVPEWESKRAMELRDFENSSPMAKLLANITKKDARLWDMAINETFGTVGAIATDASRLAEPDELPMSDRLAGLGGRVFGVVSRQSHTQAPAVVEVRSIMDRIGSQDVMRPYRDAYHASTSASERERVGRLMIEEAERILPRLRRITSRVPRNEAQLKALREQVSVVRDEVKSVAEIRFGASAR